MHVSTIAATSLPGPRSTPVLGPLGNDLLFTFDPIGYLRAAYAMHGALVAGVRGRTGWVMAFGPELNRQILSDPDRFHSFFLGIPAAEGSALRQLTSGLLSMNGALHQRHRALLLPAFHRQQVTRHAAMMTRIAEEHVEQWRVGQTVDVICEMRALALHIVCTTLLGLDAQASESIMPLLTGWLERLVSPAVGALPRDWPGTPYRALLRHSEQLASAFRSLIAARRDAPAADDALSMLVHARDETGEPLTDAELVGQAALLFIAGHETSASALAWTLLLLDQHPVVLADLRDELAGVLRGDAPSAADLERLPLLDAVVRESLRIAPPVVYGVRYLAAPTELAGFAFPARSTILYSPFMTHRLPVLFDLAAHFLPRRWETIAPAPYAYLPFGAGPRMCLGAAFATLEIKLVLAALIQRVRLTLAPLARVHRQVAITLAPRSLPMRVVEPRSSHQPEMVRGTVRDLVALPDTRRRT